MDQHQVRAAVGDAVAQAGDSVDELIGKTGKTMQEKIDQAKPALRDLQESASAALDKAGDLAQKASTAGAQAVDAAKVRLATSQAMPVGRPPRFISRGTVPWDRSADMQQSNR